MIGLCGIRARRVAVYFLENEMPRQVFLSCHEMHKFIVELHHSFRSVDNVSVFAGGLNVKIFPGNQLLVRDALEQLVVKTCLHVQQLGNY